MKVRIPIESKQGFIEDKFDDLKYSYSQDSGTIYNKLAFAKLARNHINTVQDLSPAGLEIAKKVYDFIVSQNLIR